MRSIEPPPSQQTNNFEALLTSDYLLPIQINKKMFYTILSAQALNPVPQPKYIRLSKLNDIKQLGESKNYLLKQLLQSITDKIVALNRFIFLGRIECASCFFIDVVEPGRDQ